MLLVLWIIIDFLFNFCFYPSSKAKGNLLFINPPPGSRRIDSSWAACPWLSLGHDLFVSHSPRKAIFFTPLYSLFTILPLSYYISGMESIWAGITRFDTFQDESKSVWIFDWPMEVSKNFQSKDTYLSFCSWWGWNCSSKHLRLRCFCSSFRHMFWRSNDRVFYVFNFIEF